ncbi:MAG: hypothetical protein IJZ16_09170 [Clostridia bacterium]|nr:hypothetical protein [Clostridia bacterium]
MNMKSFATLPIITILCGIFILGLGIKETATSNTKDYTETTGYFYYSTLAKDEHYDADKDAVSAPTYFLTYRYYVGGEEYTVTGSSPTAFVPSIDEEIKILYDVENPENAVIGGPSKRSNALIIIGIFFILCSLPFLVIIFGNNIQSLKVDKMGILMGLIVAIVGYGALSMICGSFSPIGIFKYLDSSFMLPLIIPILMIIAGVFSVIKSIFFYKPQD